MYFLCFSLGSLGCSFVLFYSNFMLFHISYTLYYSCAVYIFLLLIKCFWGDPAIPSQHKNFWSTTVLILTSTSSSNTGSRGNCFLSISQRAVVVVQLAQNKFFHKGWYSEKKGLTLLVVQLLLWTQNSLILGILSTSASEEPGVYLKLSF